jgi:hypothetical protein
MKMEYVAMVRRGWPNEGAVEAAEPIKVGASLKNGDWVMKQTDGTVDLTSATAANNVVCGLVIAGNFDAASAANTNLATVLWSNFVVDVSNHDTAPTYAPGNALMSVSGKLTLATGTNPVVGYVLKVVQSSATDTAHLQVLVK